MDEYERRLRLVSLTYEVIRDMKMPAAEATDEEMFLHLSWASLDKAAAIMKHEAVRRGRRDLPAGSYPHLIF
jgi:hypothetical protein